MSELTNDDIFRNNKKDVQIDSFKNQLQQGQLLLEAIAQSIPLAYIVVDDRDDRILYFNKQFCILCRIEMLFDKMKNGDLLLKDIIHYCSDIIEEKTWFVKTCRLMENQENGNIAEDEIQLTDGRVIRRFYAQVRDEYDSYIGRLYMFEDITKRKKREAELNLKHDYLTNIPNRFYLEEFLSNNHTRAGKSQDALLIMDLDNFKTINNTFGNSVGDKILISIAGCISRKLRDSDLIARTGGDEFAIFLSNTNVNRAEKLANEILTSLKQDLCYIPENNANINLTASIGIIIIEDDTDIKRLFSYAHAALNTAKSEGKDRVSVIKDEKDKDLVVHNNKILSQIKNALTCDKFQIYLQPIYKSENVLLHYEVLIRMLGEHNEILPPSSFIPLAEDYGLMPLIDRWVLTNTFKLLSNERNLNVFVNLSGRSLGDDSLLEWIEFALNNSGIDPKRIGFEITETTAIKDLQKTKMWIHRLKAMGCHFALDDFGVGFSSFSYLNMLPVDYLKIDGVFVRDLDCDETKLALVKAMNMVAHTLGKKTIAEFVENESVWGMLQELGVDCGQGYYLGRPAPLESINREINNDEN